MGISYTTVRLTALANPVGALANGHISTAAFRVWLASLEAKAIRDAAARSRRRPARSRRPVAPRFSIEEFGRITGLSRRVVRRALRELFDAEILTFDPERLESPTLPQERFVDWAATLRCGRSDKRILPFPRPFLRYLARCHRVGIHLTAVGYLVRGLSFAPRTGEIRTRGTLKASWVAEQFGLSLRAVRYAQEELRDVGWLAKDTGSTQRKLNRDGAYFAIDPAWRPARSAVAKWPIGEPCTGRPGIVKRDKSSPEFAPPGVEIGPRFAPPKEDGETPTDRKHHEARPTEPSGIRSGVGEARMLERRPTLRNITTDDLRRFDRIAALYRQAVGVGWLAGSEANALNFVAAAVRAREVDGDPVRVFVGIVRRGLWHHITQAQEERARRALSRFREVHPDLLRTDVLSQESGKRPRGGAGPADVLSRTCRALPCRYLQQRQRC